MTNDVKGIADADAAEISEFMQTASTKALLAAVQSVVDLNRIAAMELASRGLDRQGVWVGFERAAEIHGVPHGA